MVSNEVVGLPSDLSEVTSTTDMYGLSEQILRKMQIRKKMKKHKKHKKYKNEHKVWTLLSL